MAHRKTTAGVSTKPALTPAQRKAKLAKRDKLRARLAAWKPPDPPVQAPPEPPDSDEAAVAAGIAAVEEESEKRTGTAGGGAWWEADSQDAFEAASGWRSF